MITNRDLKLFVFSYDGFLQKYTIVSCIEKPIYVSYNKNYDELDTSKITVEATQQNSEALKKGNIVWIEGAVCMMIDTVTINSDDKKISVTGSLCDKVLSKRALYTELTFENTSLSYVLSQIYSNVTSTPAFSFWTSGLSGLYYSGTISPGNLLDIIQNLCKKFSLGFKVEKQSSPTNELELYIIVYSGTDRSENVILSRDYSSLRNIEYIENSQSEINFVKVLGDNNLYVDVSTQNVTNDKRSEGLLDCHSIKQGEMTEQEYLAVLSQKGQEFLSQHTNLQSYSGDYAENSFTIYEDFNVGDIVKIYDKQLDIDTTQRVTTIQVQYDIRGKYIDLQFGNMPLSLPRVVSTLSKKVEEIENTPVESSGGSAQVTLGYGLKYDSHGAICIDFDPTIVVEHAILLTQGE